MHAKPKRDDPTKIININSRFQVLKSYLDGDSLPEIAISNGYSKERARQILHNDIEDQNASFNLNISNVKEINKQNRLRREFGKKIEMNYLEIKEQLKVSNVVNTRKITGVLGLPPRALRLIEADYPELLEIVRSNTKKWSRKYSKCRRCSTTSIKHKYWGYCEKCYTKTNEWRLIQNKSRKNRKKAEDS